MKIPICSFMIILLSLKAYTSDNSKGFTENKSVADTNQVNKLNKIAFENRLVDAQKTVTIASHALSIAKDINYTKGIGESYRVIGVGNSYLNLIDSAIEKYLISLTYFQQCKDLEGQAKVYNNIGNLYRDIDLNKSLENFTKSLRIAYKLKIQDLLAGLYLNIGTVQQRKKNYTLALRYYKQSLSMFTDLKNMIGIIQAQQNLGLIYLNINNLKKSEDYLLKAKSSAKEHHLYNSIASINLTLSSVYVSQDKFREAQRIVNEGLKMARLVGNSKMEYNFILTSYELETEQKNYERALYFLQLAYRQDSITYKNNVSDKISLLEAQHRQLQKQRENELTIERQKNTKILLWASCAIAALAFFVIFLLVKNVKKSVKTNEELTRLNEEVSRQKDDLDRTNQNLEGIIEDRTKDLQTKNKKLSEYSSHLSHQIRSPVATLKGLMLLEDDKLIEKDELIEQMAKCIDDLDDKIVNINENLNNPTKSSLIADE